MFVANSGPPQSQNSVVLSDDVSSTSFIFQHTCFLEISASSTMFDTLSVFLLASYMFNRQLLGLDVNSSQCQPIAVQVGGAIPNTGRRKS